MTFDKNSSHFVIYLEISEFKRQTNCRYTRKNGFAEASKNFAKYDTNVKIIFLDQNNYVKRLSVN